MSAPIVLVVPFALMLSSKSFPLPNRVWIRTIIDMETERYRDAVESWKRVNAVKEAAEVIGGQPRDLAKEIKDFDSVFEFLRTRPDFSPKTSGLVAQQRCFKQLANDRPD